VITIEEAVLMLKKWRDDETVVCCESSILSIWGFIIRGTVTAVDEDGRVELRSSDGAATLQLSLKRAVGCRYEEVDNRRVPVLLVALPFRKPSSKRDMLSFWEFLS